jgi:FkbM family methyltransferase
MSGPRVELRGEYRKGAIDKHTFARRMGELHSALLDYASLLEGTEIGAVHIRADEVVLETRSERVLFPCDPRDRGIPPVVAMNFGAYEPVDFAMVRALMPSGGTFMDVGANIGWYSLHIAVRDPAARVLALEPVPASFRWLQAAVALNGVSNVECHQLAVGERSGTTVLYVDPSIAGAASAAPSEHTETADAVECSVVTLDAFVAEHAVTLDFLKLDIEGGELAALRGASRLLASQRPIVFGEMLRKLARPFGYHPNDIIALMAEHGYECFHASADCRLTRFLTMDDSTVETNFYFLHRDAHRSLIDRMVAD